MNNANVFTKRPLLQSFARSLLALWGWQVDAEFPNIPQYIVIVAHHTSNWDFVIGLFAALSVNFWPQWIGKDALFRPPFGSFMQWLGGIPVTRSSRNNFVEQVADLYRQQDRLIIAITPEGTRKKTDHWKTGFYHIALSANVPIVMAYIDYQRKVVGIGSLLYPTGDLAADLAQIRQFYAPIRGKYPEQEGEIRVRPM